MSHQATPWSWVDFYSHHCQLDILLTATAQCFELFCFVPSDHLSSCRCFSVTVRDQNIRSHHCNPNEKKWLFFSGSIQLYIWLLDNGAQSGKAVWYAISWDLSFDDIIGWHQTKVTLGWFISFKTCFLAWDPKLLSHRLSTYTDPLTNWLFSLIFVSFIIITEGTRNLFLKGTSFNVE